MKFRATYFLVGLLQSLLFGLLFPLHANAVTEVTIAYQGPLTGSESTYGIPQLNGVKFAITKFNATSSQYKVKLNQFDDQGLIEVAEKVAPSIANEKEIIGLVGPAFSGASRVSIPYYKASSLVMISPSASYPQLTNPNSNLFGGPVFHRINSSNYGAALAQHSIQGINSPEVYVVDAGVAGETSKTSSVVRTLGTLNAKVVGNESVNDQTTDFSPQIAKIKASGANVIVFLGYTGNSAVFAKQLRDSGLTTRLSIGPVESSGDFLALAGKSAEGARMTLETLEKIEQYSPTLEQDFRTTTGASSGLYSVEAIDSTNILLNCISQGNITRTLLLKCVKDFKGKSFLGADISFDAYGEALGLYTHVGEVRDSKFVLTNKIANLPEIKVAAVSDSAKIDLVTVSSKLVTPGERVNWNLQITVQPGYVKGVYMQLIDPNGQTRQLFLDLSYKFKTYVVDKAETFTAVLPLQTHETLGVGRYTVANICLEAEKRDCITNVSYARIFDPTLQNRQLDLSDYSFVIPESNKSVADEPLRISKITLKKTAYSPGEILVYEVEAKGTMRLQNATLNLIFANSGMSSSCQTTYFSNCSFTQDKAMGLTKILFSFPLPEDLPPGLIDISGIYLSSNFSVVGTIDSNSNSTANWSTGFYYYDDIARNDLNQDLPSDQAFDFNKYKVTLLDSGGSLKRTPTWTNLQWSSNSVAAGEDATLSLELNGYSRNISAISLYNLISTSGNQIGLNNQRLARIKPDQVDGLYPLSKSGTYQIKVNIPRSAKPGFYRIGQLSVEASNCDAKNINEWIAKISTNTGQCQGLNSWQTTYYNGTLKTDPWVGYESTPTLIIEILPATKPKVPPLTLVSADSSSIRVDYPFDGELNCSFKTDTGTLTHQEVRKGQSSNGYNNLIIIGLKPESRVKVTGSCLGTDGMQGEVETIEFKTTKPIPPAAPKINTVEIGVDYAKFEFAYREGYKYSVKSSIGDAAIANNQIQVSKIPPNSKVELQISITDPYEQTTIGDSFYFVTNKPALPVAPKFELFLRTQTRIYLKTSFNSQLQYEFTLSKGNLEVIGNQVGITNLEPGDKVTIQLLIRDKYDQLAKWSETYQSELPLPPLTPTLKSESVKSDEINLVALKQTDVQLMVKASRGQVTVSGERIRISGLAPKTSVTISVYAIDKFGQKSAVTSRTYSTVAARQRTISCTNGKATKIVVGTNPKCPTGYRIKN